MNSSKSGPNGTPELKTKPHVLLRSVPETKAASKPPLAAPAATAERMLPPNDDGIAGMPDSGTKRTVPVSPSATLVSDASLVANACACGPMVADAVKLR